LSAKLKDDRIEWSNGASWTSTRVHDPAGFFTVLPPGVPEEHCPSENDSVHSMFGEFVKIDVKKEKKKKKEKAPADDTPPPKFVPSAVELIMLAYSVLYAAVSRVPFTLFVVHMTGNMGFGFTKAAVTLGGYCLGRLCGAQFCGACVGSVTLMIGTLSGAVAWLMILFIREGWVFILATCLLGLTETVTGVDSILKLESLFQGRVLEHTQLVFRAQLFSTTFGVFIAYMGGGFLYEQKGLDYVGYCSIAFVAGEVLLLLVLFCRQPLFLQPVVRAGHIQDELARRAGKKSRASQKVEGMDRKSRVSMAVMQNLAADEEEEEDEGPALVAGDRALARLFLISVVACFFFTTIGISTQFAISALYWQSVWGMGPAYAGTLMALGEFGGTLLLMFLSQPIIFNSALTRPFSKPLNVCCACVGMSVSMLVLTIPNKAVCAVGTILVHVGNVCVHSFQAELVGIGASNSEFPMWISRSYTAKRAANAVCVFGSLFFFGFLGPQASYHCFATGLLIYGLSLAGIYNALGLWPYQMRAAKEADGAAETVIHRRISQKNETMKVNAKARMSMVA
jgi:hypothetical protein